MPEPVKMCRVTIGGKQCPRSAMYTMNMYCKGCKPGTHDITVIACKSHLDAGNNGNLICSDCKKSHYVKDWSPLVSTAPAIVDVRIGAPQRNVVLDVLADAFASEFITREEFDERSEQVRNAHSVTELAAVTSDLPESAAGKLDVTVKPASPALMVASKNMINVLCAGIILGIVIGMLSMLLITTV